MFNGLYKESCIVRESNDTFIPFNDYHVKIINPLSFSEYVSVYETCKDKENIVIDSRLEYIILMAFIKYELNILIYDSYRLLVCGPIEYFSSAMYVEATDLSLSDIQKYCIGKIILNYAFAHLRIRWNKDIALSTIRKNNLHNTRYEIAYMLIMMMNTNDAIKIDRSKIKAVYELYDDILSGNDIKCLKNITVPELYSILYIIIEQA